MLVSILIKNYVLFCGGYKEEQNTTLPHFLLLLPIMGTDKYKQGITTR